MSSECACVSVVTAGNFESKYIRLTDAHTGEATSYPIVEVVPVLVSEGTTARRQRLSNLLAHAENCRGDT